MNLKACLGSLVTAMAAIAMFGSAPVISGCFGHCAALCVNDVSATRSLAAAEADLDGAKVNFCRNGKCVDGTVFRAGAGLACTLTGSFDSFCYITAQSDGSFKAELHYGFAAGEGTDPKDGDTYSFDVFAASDTTKVLTHAQGKAKYMEYDYCGQNCYSATI